MFIFFKQVKDVRFILTFAPCGFYCIIGFEMFGLVFSAFKENMFNFKSAQCGIYPNVFMLYAFCCYSLQNKESVNFSLQSLN